MNKWTLYAIKSDLTDQYYTGFWKSPFNSDKRRPQTWSRLHDARRVAKAINRGLTNGETYYKQRYAGIGSVQVVPVELRG